MARGNEAISEVISAVSTGIAAGPPTSDEDLQAMQDEVYGEDAKKQEPKKKPVDGKKRAKEIFEKTQALNKEPEEGGEEEPTGEKPKDKEPGEKFNGSFPEFDTSQFLEGAEEGEPGEEEPEEGEPGEEEGEEVKGAAQDLDKETNIKNLRQIAGNFKKERNDALTAVETLKAELGNKPDPQGLQTQIADLQERVKQLEPYELVFALHENPAFKQKFVDAPNQVVGEMRQIAVDYGVEGEVIDHILMLDNRRELDEALEEYFSSTSARTDLKTLKQKYNGMMNERAEFEKKPREALTQFHSKKEQQDSQTNEQRDKHVKTIMQTAWNSALRGASKAPKEQKIYELIEQPGNKDHNEKVVKPTLDNAQRLLNMGMNYIEQLARTKATPSEGFAQWFAQVCQQAAATQMVNHVRWGVYERYQNLLKDQKTQREYDRPGVSTQKRTAPAKKSKKGLKEASAEIWESVISPS